MVVPGEGNNVGLATNDDGTFTTATMSSLDCRLSLRAHAVDGSVIATSTFDSICPAYRDLASPQLYALPGGGLVAQVGVRSIDTDFPTSNGTVHVRYAPADDVDAVLLAFDADGQLSRARAFAATDEAYADALYVGVADPAGSSVLVCGAFPSFEIIDC